MPRGVVDEQEHIAGRRTGDAGALSMADRDQPDLLESLHGLPDRRAADTETGHQFPLRRELSIRRKFAAFDHPHESVKDFVREFPTNDRFVGVHRFFLPSFDIVLALTSPRPLV